jgi:hypothetical protein
VLELQAVGRSGVEDHPPEVLAGDRHDLLGVRRIARSCLPPSASFLSVMMAQPEPLPEDPGDVAVILDEPVESALGELVAYPPSGD